MQVRQASAMARSEMTDAKAFMTANGGIYHVEQGVRRGAGGDQRGGATDRHRKSDQIPGAVLG